MGLEPQRDSQNDPLCITQAPKLDVVHEPDSVAAAVSRMYSEAGHLLDEEDSAALLADVLCHDFPTVGASQGFEHLTGLKRKEILGRNCRILLDGVPKVMVSNSGRSNLRDFCRMCRLAGVSTISEVTSLQPNMRQDGSQFMNFFMLGLCWLANHPFILGVQMVVGEGLVVRLGKDQFEGILEKSRATWRRLHRLLRSRQGQAPEPSLGLPPGGGGQPEFTFFHQRLQDHCILFNRNRTALRRESHFLATNCLVFGDRPVKLSEQGLSFSLLVDDVVKTFAGLPLLGFTRRKPVDGPDLYPAVAKCLGASVLIGGCNEAFARDPESNFPLGFRSPPSHEVQVWNLNPDVAWAKQQPTINLCPGDVLGCLYTREGHLQLWVNGSMVMGFDLGRPPVVGDDYYAVVDVCYSAVSLTIVPSASPPQQEAEAGAEVPAEESAHALDQQPGGSASTLVDKTSVERAIRMAVARCEFCLSVGDPQDSDAPLIAVSEGFEEMTGYHNKEILGRNCRFLNSGCFMSAEDLIGLRSSSASGAPFVALLPNMKKSGDMFVNLLDLQGFAVARSASTGQLLWYSIGIQADVTEEEDTESLQRHDRERDEMARHLRECLREEASHRGDKPDLEIDSFPEQYELLNEPYWMSGTELDADSSAQGSKDAGEAMPLHATVPLGTTGLGVSSSRGWRSFWGLWPFAAGARDFRTACFHAFAQMYAKRAAQEDAQPGFSLVSALTSALPPSRGREGSWCAGEAALRMFLLPGAAAAVVLLGACLHRSWLRSMQLPSLCSWS